MKKEMPVREVPADLLRAVCAALVRERVELNDLHRAFMTLVAERHAEFHNKKKFDPDWKLCSNPVCVTALKLLTQATSPDVRFTLFALQAALTKRVMFDVYPNMVRVFLEDVTVVKPELPNVEVPNIFLTDGPLDIPKPAVPYAGKFGKT